VYNCLFRVCILVRFGSVVGLSLVRSSVIGSALKRRVSRYYLSVRLSMRVWRGWEGISGCFYGAFGLIVHTGCWDDMDEGELMLRVHNVAAWARILKGVNTYCQTNSLAVVLETATLCSEDGQGMLGRLHRSNRESRGFLGAYLMLGYGVGLASAWTMGGWLPEDRWTALDEEGISWYIQGIGHCLQCI
jgi:hypothetical protein